MKYFSLLLLLATACKPGSADQQVPNTGNPLILAATSESLLGSYQNLSGKEAVFLRNPGSDTENLDIMIVHEATADTLRFNGFQMILTPDKFESVFDRYLNVNLKPGEIVRMFDIKLNEIDKLPWTNDDDPASPWLKANKLTPGTYKIWYTWPLGQWQASNVITCDIPAH